MSSDYSVSNKPGYSPTRFSSDEIGSVPLSEQEEKVEDVKSASLHAGNPATRKNQLNATWVKVGVAQAPLNETVMRAGYTEKIIDHGPKRKTGFGITIPIAKPKPELSVDITQYIQFSPEEVKSLHGKTIGIVSDHNGSELVNAISQYLKNQGVQVKVYLAKKEQLDMKGKISYGITGSAALSDLVEGKVDKVINICGNGLGAKEVSDLFANAFPDKVRSFYGTNFWEIAENQATENPPNVLNIGARQNAYAHSEPVTQAYVKAFLTIDSPEKVEELKGNPLPSNARFQHGIVTDQFDNLPERIGDRTLKASMQEMLNVSELDRARIKEKTVCVVYDDSAKIIVENLRNYLTNSGCENVMFTPSSQVLPDGITHVISVTKDGLYPAALHPQVLGQVTRYAKENQASAEHPLYIDFQSEALLDKNTGGSNNDLFCLMVKQFLTQELEPPKETPKRYTEAQSITQSQIKRLKGIEQDISPENQKNIDLLDKLR